MDKMKINYIVDITLIISFLITAIALIFESRTFSELHEIIGALFILFCIIHLILHWNAFICLTKNMFGKKK